MSHLIAALLGSPLAVVVAVAVSPARADETQRVSNAPNGHAGNSVSYIPSVSRDGGVVAFVSAASDLVLNDTNGVDDVFVFVRATGAIERVSVASDGSQADDTSFLASPHLSSDGRFVVFNSAATNLDANDDGIGIHDVFLRDRIARTTRRISSNAQGSSANGQSGNESITSDGRFVIYQSLASDLVAGDTNGSYDVFRYDTTTGTTLLVSVDAVGTQGDAYSLLPFISDDGSLVAFTSRATNFPDACRSDPFSGNCYRKSLVTGALERVDVDWTGTYPCADSLVHEISSDGSLVLFTGGAAYVADDTNGVTDGYLRAFASNSLERVTVKSGGAQIETSLAFVGCYVGGMSSDARFVTFNSWSDFVPLDQNLGLDDFLRDRTTGVTSIVSVGSFDEPGDGSYTNPGNVSDDGTCVVFASLVSSFAPDDTNQALDIFVRARSMTPATQLHYGAGFPGRNGTVPTLAARAPAWRGPTLDLDLTNSADFYNVAFLFVGVAREDVPTSLGGHLLVDPLTIVPVPLIPSGGTLSGAVPTDYWANGLVFDLQALEIDLWALHGVSFTDGLELTIGDG